MLDDKILNGPNVVSCIVLVGFFLALFLFMYRPSVVATSEGWAILNMLIGVLAAKFGDVIGYQIGSTRSSRAKDETIQAQAKALDDKPPSGAA